MATVQIDLNNCYPTGAAIQKIADLLLANLAQWAVEHPTKQSRQGLYDAQELRYNDYAQELVDMKRNPEMFMRVGWRHVGPRRDSYPEYEVADIPALFDQEFESINLEYNSMAGPTERIDLTVYSYGRTSISISSRESKWGEPVDIDELQEIFSEYIREPETPAFEQLPFRVFLGHGNDHQWRLLRDDLRDEHDFDVEAFEGRPRYGMTIKDVLLDMAANSTAAVVILTRADKTESGEWRGRQNVVHELGLFQGLLGWERVIVVMEDGVAAPTNLDGTQQVRYPEGQIQNATGRVVAALRHLKAQHESGDLYGHHHP